MIKEVEQIISKPIEEILSSSLALVLLNVYSKLYLHGAQPRYCEKSQREYFSEICRTGLERAKIMDEKNQSVNKCKKSGMKYVGGNICKHFDLANLTDEQAVLLLENKFLKESDFITLPPNFKKEIKSDLSNDNTKVIQDDSKEVEVVKNELKTTKKAPVKKKAKSTKKKK